MAGIDVGSSTMLENDTLLTEVRPPDTPVRRQAGCVKDISQYRHPHSNTSPALMELLPGVEKERMVPCTHAKWGQKTVAMNERCWQPAAGSLS